MGLEMGYAAVAIRNIYIRWIERNETKLKMYENLR